MAPLCFRGLKENHWLGMSQSQTPMQSHTSLTQCPSQGQQLIKRHKHKIAKYSKLASTHMFYPIAIETAGTWDDMAIELVQEIDRRTTVITQDTRETVFLFQRLSVILHSSAAGECGLLPQHNEHRIRSRCSRYLTFCLVFTPAALCWWAKIIIIIEFLWRHTVVTSEALDVAWTSIYVKFQQSFQTVAEAQRWSTMGYISTGYKSWA